MVLDTVQQLDNMQFVWVYVPKECTVPILNQPQTPQQVHSADESEKGPPRATSVQSSELKHNTAQVYQKLNLTRQDLLEAGYSSNMKPWTEQEDKTLLFYRDKKGWQWESIASKIPGRNVRMCYNRYKRILYRSSAQWRDKDNEKLLRLIEEHGQDWREIGKHFKSMGQLYEEWLPKHIKEHYLNHLRPGLTQQEWTLQDDLKLVAVLNEYNFDWAQAQRSFPERSLNQIKNRFKCRLRKLNVKKQQALAEAGHH